MNYFFTFLRKTGISENRIDALCRKMAKPTWLTYVSGLFLAILTSSCASFLHTPKDSVEVKNNGDSIIFGKDEVTLDGTLIDYKGHAFFVKKMIIHHISPYISNVAINRNLWMAGKYAYKVTDDQDGYFAFTADPGKYYYVELDYIWVLPDEPTIGLRTYMMVNPAIISFNVPTNDIVYLGTMKHDFLRLSNTWFSAKYEYKVSFTNDFSAAKKWFLDSHKENEKQFVEGIPDINYIFVTNK